MQTRPLSFAFFFFWTLLLCVGSAGCKTTGDPTADDGPADDRPAPRYRSVENVPEQEDASARQPSTAVRSKAREYQSTMVEALHEEWNPPAMAADRLNSLGQRVVVYVRMDEQGKIVSYEFQSNSGSTPFDQSIRECLETFKGEDGASLPMPDNPRLQKALVRHGMNLRNWLVE